MRPTVIGGGAVKRHMETAMCASICSYLINTMDQFPFDWLWVTMGKLINDHSNKFTYPYGWYITGAVAAPAAICGGPPAGTPPYAAAAPVPTPPPWYVPLPAALHYKPPKYTLSFHFMCKQINL